VISGNQAERGAGVYNGDGIFTMSDGLIFNNRATQDGGGIYLYNGNFTMTGGTIATNTATRNGGGISVPSNSGGVPLLTSLERIRINNNALFANNTASAAYDRASEHNSLYTSLIGGSVRWSFGISQGYNNFDISYVSDTKIDVNTTDPEASPKPSPSPSPKPSPSTSPRPSTSSSPPEEGDPNFWRYVIVIVIVVCLVVAVLFYYVSKKGEQQTPDDWIDSPTTPT
jgi:hypothetical protein